MTRDREEKIPLWRDERFWRIALQILAVVLVLLFIAILVGNLNANLRRAGLRFNFGFLKNEAGFSIGETLLPYQFGDSYIWAMLAGLVNSLRVVVVGLVLTTVLGTIAGISSFSENWLVRKLSVVYVELVRNTPLLLQLFFWYFPIFLALPKPQQHISLGGLIFMTKSGIYVPWVGNDLRVLLGLVALVLGAIAAVLIWRWRTKIMVERAASGRPQLYALIAIGIAALLILFVGLGWQIPAPTAPGQITGGLRLSLEYTAVLIGLVVYTGAFIAEIVRAGIQSVSRGQWEAARSLGLHSGLVMQLVVFPQALRVIIPSLNSQYMNLAKNSSLALAIGYPDIYAVSSTTFNQTGRPIEVFILIAAAYLTLNLIISVGMNQLNRAVQLKER